MSGAMVTAEKKHPVAFGLTVC